MKSLENSSFPFLNVPSFHKAFKMLIKLFYGGFVEKGQCCFCGASLNPEGRYERICLECKVSLQVVDTKDGMIVTK
ncbi:hypothetical protein AKJ51_03075 [candidate division MSBL1 archaeon SCGC-AAA382A20]|uniref:Uncharacterized protein n=1 Tax=candidate division MSBL1 archaeon SCGC-AAA382A20 TaxID=1698280 RepID=A0A133VJR9_9EURY|nr:hypothetical protein AKJ51_03075 [candidate division MSBL1 archaeon SCGC-AAA382A20]